MNRVKDMTAETNPHTMQTYQVNDNLDDVTEIFRVNDMCTNK